MGYETAAPTDVDSVVPDEYGGMWFLKDALDTEQLGFTVLELEPDGKGKEHDHETDGQEEIYYVVEGEVDVDLADETVTLSTDDALRLDPEETRQIHNHGDKRAKLVLAGAPR
ncbi:cupin domain-containing protein [Halococcus saccharolyticus]|uniref:Cupin n=1 Tax=Halococcus saccharolyticus DSM 5350 TaxID=1227455 RepID=M0MFB1_9EURY|nr:cupin domain-containing protein [Halococcus saccharolyticus]EMA43105.1 cupin [Halococcus saccharolyticus DSM 5350]